MYEASPKENDAAPESTLPSTDVQPQGVKTEISVTPFRLVEKKYKLYKPDPGRHNADNGRRRPPPEPTDFSDVVEARDGAANSAANVAMMHRFEVSVGAQTPDVPPELQLESGRTVVAYTFDGVPGLVFFPSIVPPALQRSLCIKGLTEYASRPHPTNLSNLDKEYVSAGYAPGMRWSTLGFSYDWTKRDYHRDRFSPFPQELRALIGQVVAALPQVSPTLTPVAEGYEAQTSIVNFYPVGSMMCAHQDVGEVCLMRPLVSLSLGCSCVFLMGTERRDDAPHAFFLRSGDVVAFTGPSRIAYHAVPRILDDCPAWLCGVADGNEADTTTLQKMQGLRLNINVRQVFDEPGLPI
jgi:alkylated DNA repair protein alkB family protein 1